MLPVPQLRSQESPLVGAQTALDYTLHLRRPGNACDLVGGLRE